MKVLVFPKDVNPYQELLYGHMSSNVEIVYFQNTGLPRLLKMLLTPFELAYFRINGFKIMHIHWFFPFSFSNKNYLLVLLAELYLLIFYLSLRALGYKIVWTVHDLLPHDKVFLNDENTATKFFNLSDALIVLNSDTRKTLIKKFGIISKKIYLIPMGSFIGHYPENTKFQKRSGFKFLFFGQVRPYKGIDSLIKSFKSLKNDEIFLDIVGKSADSQFLLELHRLINGDKRITLSDTFIPDESVGKVFSKSDFVVLPFNRITNTSSAILSFSMKKPVIAPLMAMIKDFPKDTGIYYDPSDKNGLMNALITASKSKSKLPKMSESAYRYAKSLDWNRLSRKTENVYLSLN